MIVSHLSFFRYDSVVLAPLAGIGALLKSST